MAHTFINLSGMKLDLQLLQMDRESGREVSSKSLPSTNSRLCCTSSGEERGGWKVVERVSQHQPMSPRSPSCRRVHGAEHVAVAASSSSC